MSDPNFPRFMTHNEQVAITDREKGTGTTTMNNLFRQEIARLYARNWELRKALENLVLRCDGEEGVRADGSNIDTRQAHVVLYGKKENEI